MRTPPDEFVMEREREGGGNQLTIQWVAVEIGDDPIAGALFDHSECKERERERERERNNYITMVKIQKLKRVGY